MGLKDLRGQEMFFSRRRASAWGRTFTAFSQRWFAKGYDGYSLQPLDHSDKEIHA